MRYLVYAIAMLVASMVGCHESSVAEEGAPEVVFQLDIDPRCEYDPDAPWHGLSQEELDDPKNEEVKALVDDGTPCCAFFIGDNVRFYTLFAQWRPCTLEVLNDDETVRTLVRLDTPPTGTVRIPLSVLGIDPEEQAVLRFTTVEIHSGSFDDRRNDYMLVNPKIGVESEALTHETIRELGFAEGSKHVRNGSGVQLVSEKWNISSLSSMKTFHPEKWALYTTTDDSSLHAGHSGNNGEAPSEGWWARQAAKNYFSSW